jgi:hypothetical protein
VCFPIGGSLMVQHSVVLVIFPKAKCASISKIRTTVVYSPQAIAKSGVLVLVFI